jgi:hypothetical protein
VFDQRIDKQPAALPLTGKETVLLVQNDQNGLPRAVNVPLSFITGASGDGGGGGGGGGDGNDPSKLPLTGGTLTGPLFLSREPQSATEAATKLYVDSHQSSGGGDGGGSGALQLTGGTMSGPLFLNGDPLVSTEAATKSYVDLVVAAIGGGGGGGSDVETADEIIGALHYTPAATTGGNIDQNAFFASLGFSQITPAPNSLLYFDAGGAPAALQPQTIDQGIPAATFADTDQLWLAQPSQVTASNLVVGTLSALATYFTSKHTPTVALSSNTTLGAVHHRKLLVCNATLTISIPSQFIGDGFVCDILNRAGVGHNVTLGAGITSNGGLQTIGPNKTCRLYAIGAATTGANDEYWAAVVGQDTSATAISIASIDPQTSTVPFTVSGSLSGYSSAPTLQYNDNSGIFASLPSGASVTTSGFSFTHPGMSAATGNTVTIKDTTGVTSPAISNIFTVAASSAKTVAANVPASQPFIASGSSTTSIALTATLSNYTSAPTLNYSLNNGSTYSALPGGSSVSTTAASFTLTSVAAGTYHLIIKDTTNNVTSNAVTLNVERAVLASVPTTGYTGNAVSGATVTLTAITTAYAVLFFSGADQGGRVSFTGSSVPGLTPSASGSYTLRVYDAATGGNLLAESATITVADPAITVDTPADQTASAIFLSTGTYTGPAPSNVDYRFDSTGSYTSISSGFLAASNVWQGNVTAPADVASHTLQVRETNAIGVTATSGSFAVSSAGPPVPAGSNLLFSFSADVAAGSLYSDTGGTVVANVGDFVNSIRDTSGNGWLFARSGAGNGPALTANQQNGLPGLVAIPGTRGLVCTDSTLANTIKNSTGITVFAVWINNSSGVAQPLFMSGDGTAVDVNGNSNFWVGSTTNLNVITTRNNGTSPNNLAVTATSYAGKRLITVSRCPGISGTLKMNGLMAATTIGGSLTQTGSAGTNAWNYTSMIRARQGANADANVNMAGVICAIYVYNGSAPCTDTEKDALVSWGQTKWG